MRFSSNSLIRVERLVHRELVRFSIPLLRIAVGAVFLGFGVLKFFPDVSPAQELARETTDLLTFGLVPGGVAIVLIAAGTFRGGRMVRDEPSLPTGVSDEFGADRGARTLDGVGASP